MIDYKVLLRIHHCPYVSAVVRARHHRCRMHTHALTPFAWCALPRRNCVRQNRAAFRRSTAQLEPASASASPSYTTQSPIPMGNAPPTSYSRRYPSLLPPFFQRATVVEQYAAGLWGFVQPLDLKPLGLADIRLRMVVAQLQDGTLMLHNPIAPTEELLQQLQGLGAPVKHILLSSNSPEHWLYAPALAKQFPDATLWVVAGIFDPLLSKVLGPLGLSALASTAVTLGSKPSPLTDEVTVIPFLNPFTLESAVILQRYKALLVSDAAIYVDIPDASDLVRKGAEAAGIWQRLGPVTQQLFEQYPKEGGAFVQQVLEQDIQVIIPAHGNAPVSGAKAAWQDCFSFLKST